LTDFLNLEADVKLPKDSEVSLRIRAIMEASFTASKDATPELDAMLAIYENHEEIWKTAVTRCFKRTRDLLAVQLVGWLFKLEEEYPDGKYWIGAKVYKAAWGKTNPQLWIAFESEEWIDDKEKNNVGPTYLNLYIAVNDNLLTKAQKNATAGRQILQIGPKKSAVLRRLHCQA
jgi:hypothetical protein